MSGLGGGRIVGVARAGLSEEGCNVARLSAFSVWEEAGVVPTETRDLRVDGNDPSPSSSDPSPDPMESSKILNDKLSFSALLPRPMLLVPLKCKSLPPPPLLPPLCLLKDHSPEPPLTPTALPLL